MSRRLIIIGLVLVALLGGGLFQVKLAVEDRDHQLDALYRSHMEDQKAIHVLEAEWAYLNSPDRLQKLAIRHLHLAPTLPTQVLSSPGDLPYRSGEQPACDTCRDLDSVYPAPRVKPLSGAGAVGQNEGSATAIGFTFSDQAADKPRVKDKQ